MFNKQRKTKPSRRKLHSLISANKIKPEQWQINEAEAKEALEAKGYDVKQIKKICCLKHQVSISYWDNQGNVCSSFFSYRIFARWQKEVERLIYQCSTLKEWTKLNYIMNYEFAHYNYLTEIQDTLYTALENRLYVLKATAGQTVFQYV